jgi:hypothetical protein
MFATRRLLPITTKFAKQKRFSTNDRNYDTIINVGICSGGASGFCYGFYNSPKTGDIYTFSGCCENIVGKILYSIVGGGFGAFAGALFFGFFPFWMPIVVIGGIQWQINNFTKPKVDEKIE